MGLDFVFNAHGSSFNLHVGMEPDASGVPVLFRLDDVPLQGTVSPVGSTWQRGQESHLVLWSSHLVLKYAAFDLCGPDLRTSRMRSMGELPAPRMGGLSGGFPHRKPSGKTQIPMCSTHKKITSRGQVIQNPQPKSVAIMTIMSPIAQMTQCRFGAGTGTGPFQEHQARRRGEKAKLSRATHSLGLIRVIVWRSLQGFPGKAQKKQPSLPWLIWNWGISNGWSLQGLWRPLQIR